MTTTYNTVCDLYNTKKYTEAENLLQQIGTKDATWHFLYGQLMLKKAWFDTAKAHLEKATTMRPDVPLFKNTLLKLMSRSNRYSDPYYDRRPYRRDPGCCCCCCDDCCCHLDCCDLICLDSCCECMGGDFISCI